MSEPTELLPCAHCGQHPKVEYTMNAGFIVFCKCGIETDHDEIEQVVIDIWNRRANRWLHFSDEELLFADNWLHYGCGGRTQAIPSNLAFADEVRAELTRRAAVKQENKS